MRDSRVMLLCAALWTPHAVDVTQTAATICVGFFVAAYVLLSKWERAWDAQQAAARERLQDLSRVRERAMALAAAAAGCAEEDREYMGHILWGQGDDGMSRSVFDKVVGAGKGVCKNCGAEDEALDVPCKATRQSPPKRL